MSGRRATTAVVGTPKAASSPPAAEATPREESTDANTRMPATVPTIAKTFRAGKDARSESSGRLNLIDESAATTPMKAGRYRRRARNGFRQAS
jgi:hypothetical protein